MKYGIRLSMIAGCLLFLLSAQAEQHGNQPVAPVDQQQTSTGNSSSVSQDGHNVTSLAGRTEVGQEGYELSLRAPKIDGNVFPVAVHYFDDLVNGVSKLRATLNVPLRLTITNSRKRRLLTVFSLAGDASVPYGSPLSRIKQIKLNSYKDVDKRQNVLQTFVGPNKMIFRAKADQATYNIDFILPITAKHFHQGYVQVAIAASNGEQLTEVCEITNANCMKPVKFYVVPRVIEYSYSGSDVSSITTQKPTAKFEVTKSNVDFRFDDNNLKVETVDRKTIPYAKDLAFVSRVYNPNLAIKSTKKVYVTNIDLYPIVHYMSNNRYMPSDVVILTIAHDRPDLHVRTLNTDADLTSKLYERIAQEGGSQEAEASAPPEAEASTGTVAQ